MGQSVQALNRRHGEMIPMHGPKGRRDRRGSRAFDHLADQFTETV